MAAEAQRATRLRDWKTVAAALRRFFAPVEPWYDWGPAGFCAVKDEADGDGYYFNIDWLGIHLGFTVGWTPPALTDEEIADRQAYEAQRRAEREAEDAE